MADYAYAGSSNTDWARTVATTLSDHIRESEISWMKNYQLGALLESHSRITYNHSGRGFDWPVEYRAHTVTGNTGETPRTFARRNKWKTAALPYRGYQADDAISNKEIAENRGEAAVIKLVDNFIGRLEKSIKHGLASEFYTDGNATGNEQSWHGFESMMDTNGTYTITTGAQRTANAADTVGYPSDTYAGLSTVLGNYGGEQATGTFFPLGTCDPEFDFWSPLVVNATSTNAAAFPSATDTWAGAADEILRYAILQSQRNSSVDGQITNFFLNRESYGPFLNLIDNKESIRIERGSGLELTSLGFKNVVGFDGVEVSWEAAVPSANTASQTDASRGIYGYGFNFNNIELRSMHDTLFVSEGGDYDIESQMTRFAVSTLSNLRFASPRNFVKLMTLA